MFREGLKKDLRAWPPPSPKMENIFYAILDQFLGIFNLKHAFEKSKTGPGRM